MGIAARQCSLAIRRSLQQHFIRSQFARRAKRPVCARGTRLRPLFRGPRHSPGHRQNLHRERGSAPWPKAVILSYGLWRTTFHADPHLIGQAIDLKGEPYTVVGVLPAGAKTPLNADLYIDLQPSPPGEGSGTNYGSSFACATAPTGARPTPRSTRPGPAPARRFANDFHRRLKDFLLYRPVAERANSRPSPQSAFAHVCRLVDPAHRMCQSRRAYRRPHGAAHA